MSSSESLPSPSDPLRWRDRRTLIRLSHAALRAHFLGCDPPTVPEDPPAFWEPRGVFVTLRRRDDGRLRGCKGDVSGKRPLALAVIRQAVSSATDDPRFPNVTAEELSQITVEISALAPPVPIRPEDVQIGRHGLIASKGNDLGLLLPQVPAHHGFDREAFLGAVCRKAGLPPDAWKTDDDLRLFGFEAEVWNESVMDDEPGSASASHEAAE